MEEQEGGCQLSMALFSEVVAGPTEGLLFPYNALRNAALLAARTPLVLNVDADMLLSASLSRTLADPAGYVACHARCSLRSDPAQADPLLVRLDHPYGFQ